MTIRYKNSPLHELVLGVSFKPFKNSLSIMSNYQKIVSKDFPILTENPIISKSQAELQNLRSVNSTPARFWYMSQDDTKLIQVQCNRFLYNWRKTPTTSYPLLSEVMPAFIKELSKFIEWMKNECKIEIIIESAEITYVNHVGKGCGWHGLRSTSELIDIFPVNTLFNQSDASGNINLEVSYKTNGSSAANIKIVNGLRMSDMVLEDILIMELTQEVVMNTQDLKKLEEDLYTASGSIFSGFEKIVTSRAKEIWEREET